MGVREVAANHAERTMGETNRGAGLWTRFRVIGNQGVASMVATVVGFSALTVGQPLLGVLAQSPEFFVAKDMTTWDIVFYVSLLLGMPIAVGLVISWVGAVNRGFAGALLVLVVSILVAVLAANGVKRSSMEGFGAVTASVAVGLITAMLYVLSGQVRAAVRWLALAAPLIMAWFLLITPISALVIGGDEEPVGHVTASESHFPIVLLLLDELPLATLMNGSGEFLADQFPGLARLKSDGVWYRNATSVADRTKLAVPSILTGRRSEPETVPISSDHPNSLFTALDPIYDMSGLESITSICPDTVCGVDNSDGPLSLWRGLIVDSGVVLGHLIVPLGMDSSLPPLDTGWEGFGAGSVTPSPDSSDSSAEWSLKDVISPQLEARAEAVEKVLAATAEVKGTGDAVIAHLLLPHLPWEHLADGTVVEAKGYQAAFGDGTNWTENPWLRSQAVQRHVLATQYVDSLVTQMIASLESSGVYDDSMVIVVADHGLSFEPKMNRRNIKEATVGSVAAVPLIVKYPSDSQGVPPSGTVSDAPIETTDVVPTIFDVIGADDPYTMDGQSILEPIKRTERVMTGVGGRGVTFGVDGDEKFAAAELMDELLPGRAPWALLPGQESEELLGQTLAVTDHQEVTLVVDQPEKFADVDPDGGVLPSVVTGTVEGPRVAEGDRVVILIRGTVVTVTEVYAKKEGGLGFYALVHPNDFIRGENAIEPVLVSNEGEFIR